MMSEENKDKKAEPYCPPEALIQINAEPMSTATIPDLDLVPDPKLIAEGWERRFMADALREEEAIQLYEELGFEVRSEAVRVDELNEVCGDCRLVACNAYTTIYTRKVST